MVAINPNPRPHRPVQNGNHSSDCIAWHPQAVEIGRGGTLENYELDGAGLSIQFVVDQKTRLCSHELFKDRNHPSTQYFRGDIPLHSPYIWYSYLHFRILKFPLINKTDPLDSPISKSWSCILHPRTISTVNPAACCYALNGSSSHHIIPYHITSDHFISRQLTAYHITIITSSRAFH